MRLDVVVGERFTLSRNKSQACIKEGLVLVNNIIMKKPSYELHGDENITLIPAKKIHWVSRSAGKLDGFLESLSRHFEEQLRIEGVSCLDVGSSTGGFTQVLLERGASHIDAVDVGTAQLHESLRSHPQVTSYEQTDIRNFASIQSYDMIVCDASFISIEELLPSILKFAGIQTKIILLWKPQFEVGRAYLRKTGVPKDEKRVQERQKEWESFLSSNNCEILQKEKSTILGEAGNAEWLYLIQKNK